MATGAALISTGAEANIWKLRGGPGGTAPPPLVGPSTSWDGSTTWAGRTKPVDGARTTAKPACQWWQPSELRAATNLVIGVDADAGGMVANVVATISGNTLTLATLNGVTSVPTIAAGGSGGTNGSTILTGTTGAGVKFTLGATIVGGALVSINSIIFSGAYTTSPTTLSAEPVTGAGLVGATVSLTGKMAVVTFGTVAIGQKVDGAGASPAAYGTIISGSGQTWTLDTSSTVAALTPMLSTGPTGVTYVDFWVEGTVQRVAQSLYLDTDVNGTPRARLGFWITLNVAAMRAVSTTGMARIYATAYPNDTSMQPRVIGEPPVNTAGENGDRIMAIYPRTTTSDFAKTIGASGRDFTNLDAAIVAAKAANAEAAEFTLTDNGAFYEISTVSGSRYIGVKGFHVIKCAGGVSASVGRLSFPTGANVTNQAIEPLFDGLEFQGSGLTLDYRNFTALGNGAMVKPNRANGCKITNSIGSRDNIYFNKGFVSHGFGIAGYIQDCPEISHLGEIMVYNLTATHNKGFDLIGRVFSRTKHVVGNYLNNIDATSFRVPLKSMEITYTGPNGPATISNISNGTFVLNDALGSLVITLGSISTDANFSYDQLAATVSARAGWSATAFDLTRHTSGSVTLPSGADANGYFSNLSVTSVPVQINSAYGIHCDIFQTYNGGSLDNIIIRDCTIINTALGGNSGMTSFLLDSTAHDMIVSNFAMDRSIGGCVGYMVGNHSHLVFRNCMLPQSWVYSNPSRDVYCRVEQCLFGQMGDNSSPTVVSFKDCHFEISYPGSAFLNDVPCSGNTFHASPFDLTTLTLNGNAGATAGDFRPGATLLAALKPSVSPYDGLGNLRAGSDAIGPVSKLQALAPVWPF